MSGRVRFLPAEFTSKPVVPMPAASEREERVRLIGGAAEALLQGRLPSPAERLFLGGALLSWLTQGGSLERDFLRVTKARSKRTPAVIWRDLTVDADQASDQGPGRRLTLRWPR
jgi:hypothetical protein